MDDIHPRRAASDLVRPRVDRRDADAHRALPHGRPAPRGADVAVASANPRPRAETRRRRGDRLPRRARVERPVDRRAAHLRRRRPGRHAEGDALVPLRRRAHARADGRRSRPAPPLRRRPGDHLRRLREHGLGRVDERGPRRSGGCTNRRRPDRALRNARDAHRDDDTGRLGREPRRDREHERQGLRLLAQGRRRRPGHGHVGARELAGVGRRDHGLLRAQRLRPGERERRRRHRGKRQHGHRAGDRGRCRRELARARDLRTRGRRRVPQLEHTGGSPCDGAGLPGAVAERDAGQPRQPVLRLRDPRRRRVDGGAHRVVHELRREQHCRHPVDLAARHDASHRGHPDRAARHAARDGHAERLGDGERLVARPRLPALACGGGHVDDDRDRDGDALPGELRHDRRRRRVLRPARRRAERRLVVGRRRCRVCGRDGARRQQLAGSEHPLRERAHRRPVPVLRLGDEHAVLQPVGRGRHVPGRLRAARRPERDRAPRQPPRAATEPAGRSRLRRRRARRQATC